ncbi:MAG TPA: TetR/AcrR family transcriptional regulator [Candidatus Dormibacteraeota bacterium]|jgi:AcrR family transcriptional regulator|nr:TetR/AcrR family transcriptional regulator [Candidatus Dormibacteraeota bacterium]
MGEIGLRQRKKERTRRAISEAAIALFLERGYDSVSVADIAEAAEVSKPTLFSYFPTKGDLVVHRFADHEDELARAVRGRRRGETPLVALRGQFLSALEHHDPAAGLNDAPPTFLFCRMLFGTPSLDGDIARHIARSEVALTAALREADGNDRLTTRLAAVQVVAVRRVLSLDNWRAIERGRTAADVYPEAVTAANLAFGLLRRGLGDLGPPAGA